MLKIDFVDSHTGGEPTRVVLAGFPLLPAMPLTACVTMLRKQYDHYRTAVCTEPRASDVMVGALLRPPVEPGSVASVVYFNNVGYLGMCGHGSIGVISTLQYLKRIEPGVHHLDTPVGTVHCELQEDGRVSMENIVSYRYRHAVTLNVPGFNSVTGDVAWGGNWFFLTDAGDCEIDRSNIAQLTAFAKAIRLALVNSDVTGINDAEIDHIELFGPPSLASLDSRSFVLCPGNEYDRSPCGTGTSAKLACLAADGKLVEGEVWRQESVIGSVFDASYRVTAGGVIPTITGRAFVTGKGSLLLDPSDPLQWGIA
ncbi:MAG: proline racemase family protein [Pseudomonadota bacterium]